MSAIIQSFAAVVLALLLMPSLAIGGEIHLVAEMGDADRLEQILDIDPSMADQRDESDSTPLHIAAEFGRLDAVKVLLAHGADIEAADRNGETPLQRAAGRGQAQTVQLLLDSGAYAEATDWVLATALHIAARSRKGKEGSLQEVMRILIARGASIDHAQQDGETPLHQAASAGHAERVAILLSAGAHPNARTKDGLTPVHLAAYSGSVSVIANLAEHGAEVDALAKSGESPLLMALAHRQTEAARRLLELGADVDTRSYSGTSPLLVAVKTGDRAAGELLLTFGADIDGINQLSTDTPLIEAAARGQSDMVQWLIAKGASVSARRRNGETALHVAAREGRVDVIELLVQHGISVNEVDRQGKTPLHEAAAGGQIQSAGVLIKHKSDVRLRDSDGNTPLHWAASIADLRMVKLLMSAGADVAARNDIGFSALDLANRRVRVSPDLLKRLAIPDISRPLALVGGLGDPATLEFSGNKSFSSDSLRFGLLSNTDLLVTAYPVSPLTAYLRVIQYKLEQGYLAAGFPQAKISARVAADDQRIQVEIEEGPRFVQGNIRIEGASTISVERLLQRLTAVQPRNSKAGDADSPREMVSSDDGASTVWYPGLPAPFDKRLPARLEASIERNLMDIGYNQAKVAIEVVPDPATRTADLVIRILDEGPKAPIARIDIFGNARNSRNAILNYLALDSEIADNPESLGRIEAALVRSGRFLEASARVKWTGLTSKLPKRVLVIRVVESPFGPVLGVPLTANQALLSKVCDWLEGASARGDGYYLEFMDRSGQRLAQVALSAAGLSLAIEQPTGENSGTVLFAGSISRNGIRLFDWKTGLNSVLPLPAGFTANATLQAGHLSFGATLKSGVSPRETPDLRLAVEKSECLMMADGVSWPIDQSKRVVTLGFEGLAVTFETATGRLLEAVVALPSTDLPGLGDWATLRMTVVPDVLGRFAARMRSSVPPLVEGRQWPEDVPAVEATLIDILMTRDPFAAVLFPNASAETRQRAAHALEHILAGNTAAKLSAILERFVRLVHEGTAFRIPQGEVLDSQSVPDLLAERVVAGLHGLARIMVPSESWPAAMTRLTALIHGRKALYVGSEIDRALADQSIGPIGYLAGALMLRRAGMPEYRGFAHRGVEELTTEGFHKDTRLLLDDGWPLGQLLAGVGTAIHELPAEDAEALVEVLPMSIQQAAWTSLLALQSPEATEPFAGQLQASLDALWGAGLRQWIATRLEELE